MAQKKKSVSKPKNTKKPSNRNRKEHPVIINLPVLYQPKPKAFLERYEEIIKTVCDQLAHGESLRSICKIEGMPSKSTIMLWLTKDKLFADQYARAREIGLDTLAEQMIEIADDGTNDTYRDDDGIIRTDHDVIARSRLRVDVRKWYLSKLAPKKYGERIEHVGEIKHKHQAQVINYDSEEEAERAHRELLEDK